MDLAHIGLLWLMSLLAATFLGYDRGRWAAGLLLGLCFGPLGVIAAGLMQPSVESCAQRARAAQRHLATLGRMDRAEMLRRRKEKAALDAFVHDVEGQLEIGDLTFADGLRTLARDLEGAAGAEAASDGRMRNWAGWLHEKAGQVESTPRYTREEV